MKIIIILLTIFNALSMFSQTNRLESLNGNFELGTIDSWRFVEVNSNAWLSSAGVTNDSYEGNWASEFTWAIDPAISDLVFDQSPTILPETDYIYKAVAKSLTGACILRMHCTFYDASNNVLLDVNDSSWVLTNTYEEHTWALPTSPLNTDHVVIGFRVFNSNGTRWPSTNMTTLIDDVRLLGSSTDLEPSVMVTSLPTEDVPIASINVMESPYNAKNDGSLDATEAFQDAINRASIAGGAVVFVPSGEYRFDGNLTIPEGVILRGEWENPENGNRVKGTILMPYANKGTENAPAFISIDGGSGIKNLSIWYPEQSAPFVSSYPWTILCHPDEATGAFDNASVINVTLVNSYNGIKVGPVPNELHYIRNVYGTPLNEGIWLSQTTDIGRIMNVHFEPKYWSTSGLNNSPSEVSILSWLQNNVTTGIVMGRSDWEYIYEVSLIGYQTGVKIFKYSDHGPNGVIYGLTIEKSKIGIDLLDVSPIGWAITNSSIKVEGDNSVCVQASNAFNSLIQFNTCVFGGNPLNNIKFLSSSTGRMSFQNCTFENWAQTGNYPAIDCVRGSVSLIGNTFNLDKLHVRLGSNVTNTQILDNIFPTTLKIENSSASEIIISQESLNTTKQTVSKHPFADVPRPISNNLFDVMNYGAVADAISDNTSAFQLALNAASLNGGGTVYVPSGMYKISGHIVVPTGVELRGIWDTPHHTMSKGSVLFAYEGKNDAQGTPFISLESGSGVRGFTIWYPEQSIQNFYQYPWSIQTLGDNCWIKDVTLGNTYQGVDLASNSSTGHRVSYLAGSPLKTGISVDKSTGEGWVENVQFNPHYWARSNGYPSPITPDIQVIIAQQQSQLDAFKIASVAQEHILGTFVYGANKGMYLAPDDGNSNVNIFLHGTDAGSNGIYLANNSGSKVNFINSQLVILGSNQNGIITSDVGFGAEASFYNSISWGGLGITTNFNGSGNILLQQLHTYNGTLELSGGTTRLENIAISSSIYPQYSIGDNVTEVKLFGSYSGDEFRTSNSNTNRSIVELDYYYNKNLKIASLETSWEDGDIQNSWDNMIFGNKEIDILNNVSYQCKSINTDEAHSGFKALKISGNKIGYVTPYYKVFDSKVLITEDTSISYWLMPKNETGRSGHVDVLFTDGTRLTELSKLANDGLLIEDSRGVINGWTNIVFPIGNYAVGKSIQSILIGAKQETSEEFDFLIDDLSIGLLSLSVDDEMLNQSISCYPNPASNFVTIQSELSISKVEVYSVLGKKVKEVNFNFNSISLNNLSSGNIYFFKIYTDKGIIIKKIIKT